MKLNERFIPNAETPAGRTRTLGIAAVTVFVISLPSFAQTSFRGSVDDLKAATIRRAEINQHPMIGLKADEVREAMSHLPSKDADSWAGAFIPIGDRYFSKAKQEETTNRRAALDDYGAAYRYYTIARWPAPTSPMKLKAYEKAREAFNLWDKLVELPTEVLRVPFERNEVVALLRMPKPSRPAPLLIQLGGLDGYKENNGMEGSLRYARMGVAVLCLDSPGTGQAVKVTANALQSLVKVIDQVLARPDIDKTRVVVHGGSWGSYWAARLAYEMPDRFKGIVLQGPPVDRSFAADHIQEVVDAGEYFFDWEIALQNAFDGVATLPQLRTLLPAMSLKTLGYLGRPTPPMLVLNGAGDTIFPIQDAFLLLSSGTAKDAWINPGGIHMGRQSGVWENARITEQVISPWVFRHLDIAKPEQPASR